MPSAWPSAFGARLLAAIDRLINTPFAAFFSLHDPVTRCSSLRQIQGVALPEIILYPHRRH
jgi:predicted alpha/beta-fold hydrolase